MLRYLNNLEKKESIITDEGKEIKIYQLDLNLEEDILKEWADHFRNQYCDDRKLLQYIKGTGMEKEEWLLKNKFPSENVKPGPSTRAGDFGEILVADYIEFIESYYVPRTKFSNKINPNTSPQGSDVIGMKMGKNPSSNDELYIIEVKTRATECCEENNRLQNAIDDSSKDYERLGFSLSALKVRLIELGREEESLKVERFQNCSDNPFKIIFGASAIYTTEMIDIDKIKKIKIPEGKDTMNLFIIHADKLMKFIHDLYRRASKC